MTNEINHSIKQIINTLESDNAFLRLKFPFKLEDPSLVRSDFLEFTKKIGTPLSQDVNGQLILSVKNQSLSPNDAKVRGPNTNKKLSFHSDRCDVIAFLCLQPARSGGENQIVQSEEVEQVIRKERIDLHSILSQKFPYKTHTIDGANPLPYCEQPIFSNRDGFFCLFLPPGTNRPGRPRSSLSRFE